jgi:glutamate carboxypeptidase
VTPFLRQATEKQEEIVALTRSLVERETPTTDPSAINRCLEFLIETTRDIASARVFKAREAGHHLRLDFHVSAPRSAPRLLALGHTDTVWEHGTLRQMPFRRDSDRLFGPGVLDMKAGIAFFLTAMRILRDTASPCPRRISMLLVSDEETGSKTSRPLTEAEAQKSERVFVLEPGTTLAGHLKTSRKGVARYELHISGRPSTPASISRTARAPSSKPRARSRKSSNLPTWGRELPSIPA